MDSHRSFDEHVDLYVEFARRVANLDSAAWDRLAAKCAAIDGPDISAVFARGRLMAKGSAVPGAPEMRKAGVPAMLGGALTAFVTALSVATELTGEFEAPAVHRPLRRREGTGKAGTDRFMDAALAIHNAVAPLQHQHPGVAAAVTTASQAVLRHDWLDPEDFATVYAFVEDEIPFATFGW